eukprot:g10115.t1
MIKKYLRNVPTLLLKTARTGKVEVWEIVVKAIKAAGQHLLEKALMATEEEDMFATEEEEEDMFAILLRHREKIVIETASVLTEAVASGSPAMVSAVRSYVEESLSQHQAREIVLKAVRKLGLLLKAASTGNVEMWETVMKAVNATDDHLFREALQMEPWHGDTVLTSAVLTGKRQTLEEVFGCVEETLSHDEANEVVRASMCDVGLLVKAARTGAIEIWRIVLHQLRGRGLFHQALMTTHHEEASISTVLTGAVESKEPSMLEEVLACLRNPPFLSPEEADEIIQKSAIDAGLLVKAARTGAIDIWVIAVKELRGRGLLQEGLTKTHMGETVLTGAVASKEVTMLERVVTCVRNTDDLTHEEAKQVIDNSFGDGTLLSEAARTGDCEIWTIVVELAGFVEQDVIQTALERYMCGALVLTAAAESEEPAMFKKVLEFVRKSFPDEKDLQRLLARNIFGKTVLHLVARHGNIGMWEAVVDVLKEEKRMLEEVLTTTGGNDETVLTAAAESKEPAMVREVFDCVRRHIPDREQLVSLILCSGFGNVTLLDVAATTGNIGTWEALEEILDGESLLYKVFNASEDVGNYLLFVAAQSKEPAMVRKVIECVRSNGQQMEPLLCLHRVAMKGDDVAWATVVDVLQEEDLLREALKTTSWGSKLLEAAVWGGNVAIIQEVLELLRTGSDRKQGAERYETALLEAWRQPYRLTVGQRAAFLTGLLQLSVRPSYEDLKVFEEDSAAKNDPSSEDPLKRGCLDTVVSADNPFVPGMTLSVLLNEQSATAGEGDQRKLRALRDRIDALLLEILERLPKTVRGFPGGMEGCAAMFAPDGLAQDAMYLPGPLAVALQKRRQTEVFCTAPLVMDFLSLVFKKGLPDLRDTSKLRHNEEGLEYLRGKGHESLVLGEDESFLQGTFTLLGDMTLLPGAQFIAAGVAAKPCSYYHVPALRMVLDFLVYAGMLVFFCTSVLLFEEGESIDDEGPIIDDTAITPAEIVFAVYLVAGIWTEICEMRRGLAEYLADGWNCLDVLGLAVTLSGFGVRCVDPSSPWGRSLYALSAPLLVSRILFFAQVLPFQGPMVQVLFLMMREMFRFAVVLLVVMLGFTLSFHALFRADDTYGRTCLNLFKAMLGEVGFFDEISEDRYESRYKSVATVLLVVYLIIITIVLLNLLIAVLSTKHAEVQEHADQEYRVLRARLIRHYQLVVQEDLLPAPFNVVQLPFRWHAAAKRRVGYVVFWLVVGPAAVVGGSLLWVVSAFLLLWKTDDDLDYRLFPAYLENVDKFERRNPIRVDDMLQAEGEPSVKELLKFLVDPLSDDKVREDEREKATTVEHVKLLRYRLEKAFETAIQTTDRKVDTLHAATQTTDRKVDILHERMNDLMKLMPKQGIREGVSI